MENKYWAIIIIVLAICIGVFLYQYNNDVSTFMIFNASEVPENGSVSGQLVDSYGQGVANKTITYHKPGYQIGTIVTATTDEHGVFNIENMQSLPDAGDENYYGDFTFAGDDKYLGCVYENNISVI